MTAASGVEVKELGTLYFTQGRSPSWLVGLLFIQPSSAAPQCSQWSYRSLNTAGCGSIKGRKELFIAISPEVRKLCMCG